MLSAITTSQMGRPPLARGVEAANCRPAAVAVVAATATVSGRRRRLPPFPRRARLVAWSSEEAHATASLRTASSPPATTAKVLPTTMRPSRRLTLAYALTAFAFTQTRAAVARGSEPRVSREVTALFARATGEPSALAAERIWTVALEGPGALPEARALPSAWSNRGAIRLQLRRWEDAAADFARAADLERERLGEASPFVLNQQAGTRCVERGRGVG